MLSSDVSHGDFGHDNHEEEPDDVWPDSLLASSIRLYSVCVGRIEWRTPSVEQEM
jgi:hypothetical protein